MSTSEKQKDDIVETRSDSDEEKFMEISANDDESDHSNYENYWAQRNPMVFKPRPIRKAAQLAQKRWRKAQLKTQATTSYWEENTVFEFKQSHSQLPSGNRGDRSTCHPCRRYLSSHSAQCSQCDTNFCQRCLRVRHGENVFEVSKPELQWVCPKCRTGCGAGCEARCCTCSTCCRAKGTQPRDKDAGRNLIKDAQSAGFSLHDYLIHLKTRESKEEIAKRKRCWVWTKASSKCTSTELKELKSDDFSAEQEAEFSIKREDFTPHDDMGHNDKMRQIEPNELDVASDEKEIHLEKGNKGDDPGRLDTKEENGTRSKALSDCAVAIDDVEEKLYFTQLLWSGRETELIGDKWSITLRDKDVQLRNAIKARSPANGIAYIFNSTNFNQPQDEKEWMKKCLKDCLGRHLADYSRRAAKISEDVDLLVKGIIENVEKAVDAIPSHI